MRYYYKPKRNELVVVSKKLHYRFGVNADIVKNHQAAAMVEEEPEPKAAKARPDRPRARRRAGI